MENETLAASARWYGPDCDLSKKPRPTPAQLEALRPKPGVPQAGAVDEARAIAHRAGVAELAPIIQRLINVERTIVEMGNKSSALETSLVGVKYPTDRHGRTQR